MAWCQDSRTRNEGQVSGLQQLDVHAREAVEEGLGQAAPAAALLQRVLRGEDPEPGRAAEGAPQLWDEDLRAVVQHRVQALQHALACAQGVKSVGGLLQQQF